MTHDIRRKLAEQFPGARILGRYAVDGAQYAIASAPDGGRLFAYLTVHGLATAACLADLTRPHRIILSGLACEIDGRAVFPADGMRRTDGFNGVAPRFRRLARHTRGTGNRLCNGKIRWSTS